MWLKYFPIGWRIADVAMVHKAGKDRGLPGSYRPIRLLSNTSKLTKGDRHEESRQGHRFDPIPEEQFGFRCRISTV